MRPIYEENEETLEIAENISSHISPHLHKSMELVSVTEGTLELGIGAGYIKDLQQMCPVNPVIAAADVHPDVNYALRSMLIYPAHSQEYALHQAFIQIILARTIPLFHLLLQSNRTVLDICIQAGFESQRTFNRVFQERYHVSPREYRKQMKQ